MVSYLGIAILLGDSKMFVKTFLSFLEFFWSYSFKEKNKNAENVIALKNKQPNKKKPEDISLELVTLARLKSNISILVE